MRRCDSIDNPDCKRDRGRVNKNWNEVMRLTEDMAQDRNFERSIIKVLDLK